MVRILLYLDSRPGMCRNGAIERVVAAVERDTFMSPEEAKAFGLVDNVIAGREPIAGGDESKR